MAREKFQTLTEQMYYVLLVLLDECCGVDIMQRVQEISEGRVKIGPGTLYTLLANFLEAEMIIETEVSGRKRSYIISDYGKEVLDNERNRLLILLNDYKKYRGK